MTSPTEKGMLPNTFRETKAILGYKPLLYQFSTNSGKKAKVFTKIIWTNKSIGRMYFLFTLSFKK